MPLEVAAHSSTLFTAGCRQQRREYALLATQGTLPVAGYDEAMQRAPTKRVPITNGPQIGSILAAAEVIRAGIPDERYDFERATGSVIARTAL